VEDQVGTASLYKLLGRGIVGHIAGNDVIGRQESGDLPADLINSGKDLVASMALQGFDQVGADEPTGAGNQYSLTHTESSKFQDSNSKQ